MDSQTRSEEIERRTGRSPVHRLLPVDNTPMTQNDCEHNHRILRNVQSPTLDEIMGWRGNDCNTNYDRW